MTRRDVDDAIDDFEELAPPAPPEYGFIDGVVIGRLVGLRGTGDPLVIYPGQPGTTAIVARAVLDVRGEQIGRDVVLAFESRDPHRPIVLGCLAADGVWPLQAQPGHVEVEAGGERLIISATREVVVRCGEASITLTREGRIVLRGINVVSHASGVNRIRGGSVQIN